MRRRLEGLLPAAGDVLDAFLSKGLRVKCSKCEEWSTVKVPDSLALKAALAVMDRTGMGPGKTVIHEKKEGLASHRDALETLMQEILALPYPERVALAQGILPEQHKPLSLQGYVPPEPPGDFPVEDTN